MPGIYSPQLHTSDGLPYRCPRCADNLSFPTLQSLRSHLETDHAYSLPRSRGSSGRSSPLTTSLTRDARDLERRLALAKEAERRHKLQLQMLTRDPLLSSRDPMLSSRDPLLPSRDAMLSSRVPYQSTHDDVLRSSHDSRQSSCESWESGRESMASTGGTLRTTELNPDELRYSAQHLLSSLVSDLGLDPHLATSSVLDQRYVIDRLKEQLQYKDSQLNKASNELHNLTEDRVRLQREVIELSKQTGANHSSDLLIQAQIKDKDRLIEQKQREVRALQDFLQETGERETSARHQLQHYIETLLRRTERAEKQLNQQRQNSASSNKSESPQPSRANRTESFSLKYESIHDVTNPPYSSTPDPKFILHKHPASYEDRHSPIRDTHLQSSPRSKRAVKEDAIFQTKREDNESGRGRGYTTSEERGGPTNMQHEKSPQNQRKHVNSTPLSNKTINLPIRTELLNSDKSDKLNSTFPVYHVNVCLPAQQQSHPSPRSPRLQSEKVIELEPERDPLPNRHDAGNNRTGRSDVSEEIGNGSDGFSVTEDASDSASVTSQSTYGSSHRKISKRKGRSMTSSNGFSQRHYNMLFCVFMYLDVPSLLQVSCVCKTWLAVARDPALWRRIVLSSQRLSSQFLCNISKWCTQVVSLTLEGIKPRSLTSRESREQYEQDIRGSLESGLEALLKENTDTLLTLRIVDCGELFTDRCLWLASCYSRNLQRVAYLSDTDPAGQEVIYSLGAGCRHITTLILPPMYPNMKPHKFSNKSVQLLSRCWPGLKVVCIGGVEVDSRGLTQLAKNCQALQVLELDHMCEVRQDAVKAMCDVGLRHLAVIDFTFTPVTPKAVVHLHASCPKLRMLNIHIGISDYYEDTTSEENIRSYATIVNKLKALRTEPGLKGVLHIKSDYG